MKIFPLTFTLAVSAFFLNACGTTDGGANASGEAAKTVKPYRWNQCLVIELPLTQGGGPFTRVYEGREVKFCCRPCIKTFEANQKIFMAKLDRWEAGGGPTSSPVAPQSGGE